MGTSNELMVFNALANSLSREDQSVSGIALSVSPDGTTLVMTDPVRQLGLCSTAQGSNSVVTSAGAWPHMWRGSPDSSTVYITAGNELLVHSAFTGWTTISGSTAPPLSTPATDVAVTVPNAGAFLCRNDDHSARDLPCNNGGHHARQHNDYQCLLPGRRSGPDLRQTGLRLPTMGSTCWEYRLPAASLRICE